MDLYTDGSIRDKAKRAGIGGWLQLSQAPRLIVHEFSREIEYFASINWIEYTAVIHGVVWALENGFRAVYINTDSNLVVQQVLGNFACNQTHLEEKRRELLLLLDCLDKWSITHIPREVNTHADMLAGAATGRADAVTKYELHQRRTA